MKKMGLMVFIAVLFLIPAGSFAEKSQQGTNQQWMGQQGMNQQGMGRGMGGGMMMPPKKEATMVAVPDGGVIVLIGNRLLKYDKDLNLKKEVEIKSEVDEMMDEMEEMVMPKESKSLRE